MARAALPQYWLVNLDPEFCTVDDLRLNFHGWSYDRGAYDPAIRKGDIAILFDRGGLKFKRLGLFMSIVSCRPELASKSVRYDFLIEVTSRSNTDREISFVKRRLVQPRHPLKGIKWLNRVFTRLNRAEFNDLMSAWWGVSDYASELDKVNASPSADNFRKYSAYVYAFDRLTEAIERGFYLEAVALEEGIISDRLSSACERAGVLPKKPTLMTVIDAARELAPPLICIDELQRWREDRNRVLHGVVKTSAKSPLLPPPEFIELSERTALNGVRLARLVSNWEKRVRRKRSE